MKAFFVSDLHIKDPEKNKALLFTKFLRNLPNDTTHLILLGDIFDLWVGDHTYFKNKFKEIIAEIKVLTSRGIEVHYFEGNHDLHLEKFWEKDVGVKIHKSFHYFSFGNLTVRAEHGDQMNPKDTGYIFLRWFLRTPPLRALSYNIPGKWVQHIGERSSQISRVYTDRLNKKYIDQVTQLTRTYSQKVYKEKPFDIFICGHTHVFDDCSVSISGKSMRSINLGTWLEKPIAFMITPSSQTFIDIN